MAAAWEHLERLAGVDRRLLESWLSAFNQAWHEGQLAERVQQLPPPGSALRLPALVEMVKIDLERQWQQGRQILVEIHLKAYPELGTPENVPPDLLQAEFEVRRQFGTTPHLEEYQRRFPQQAAALHQLFAADRRVLGAPVSGRRGQETMRGQLSTNSLAGPALVPATLPEQFGRYRIIKQLGRGGMGTVYLARDTQLDRQVALKVPHFTPECGPKVLERFDREARAAATLDHPNICPVYDSGQIHGVHYLTMAYIEGRPLSGYIHADKPLPQRQVAAVVRKLALALHEAHQHGVVHQDLKPSNIWCIWTNASMTRLSLLSPKSSGSMHTTPWPTLSGAGPGFVSARMMRRSRTVTRPCGWIPS